MTDFSVCRVSPPVWCGAIDRALHARGRVSGVARAYTTATNGSEIKPVVLQKFIQCKNLLQECKSFCREISSAFSPALLRK